MKFIAAILALTLCSASANAGFSDADKQFVAIVREYLQLNDTEPVGPEDFAEALLIIENEIVETKAKLVDNQRQDHANLVEKKNYLELLHSIIEDIKNREIRRISKEIEEVKSMIHRTR